jgi:hypothetical protein
MTNPRVSLRDVLSNVVAKRAKKVVAEFASAAMPGSIKLQLATLKAMARPATGGSMKSSSTATDKGRKRVFTRNGWDWTRRFSVIASALDNPGQAILDGGGGHP